MILRASTVEDCDQAVACWIYGKVAWRIAREGEKSMAVTQVQEGYAELRCGLHNMKATLLVERVRAKCGAGREVGREGRGSRVAAL